MATPDGNSPSLDVSLVTGTSLECGVMSACGMYDLTALYGVLESGVGMGC